MLITYFDLILYYFLRMSTFLDKLFKIYIYFFIFLLLETKNEKNHKIERKKTK